MHEYRTHTCGELRKFDIGKKIRLSGWVHNRRDHGGVLFIDLRDHYGITQVVIYPDKDFQYNMGHLSKETVIRIDGEVAYRSDQNVNPKMVTGEIEIDVTEFEVLGLSEQVPFTVFQEEDTPEELRLKYRYIDLRRAKMHENIILRSKIIAFLRKKMEGHGFTEYQTPILTSSSPEGARDYLVPSRVHPGEFYALPQAPQQFKQLLMASGFDKYFQIAPCFRDEDARADRSPGEFYQLDIEMSFVTQEDIFAIVEDVLSSTFSEFADKKCDTAPFVRIPFKDAMLKYGSDKPDLRIPIEISDITNLFGDSGFNAFDNAIADGSVVRVIPVKGIADRPRSFFDKLIEYAQSIGSKGLAYLVWTPEKIKGPIAKFLSEDTLANIKIDCKIEYGDVLFFVCDKPNEAARIAGDLRVKLGTDLGLIDDNVFKFCWIVDFPMFEMDFETNKIDFSHNPFSMPQGGMQSLEEKDPLEILAYQYDIVCNGIELSSGAIRNYLPEVMYKAFNIAGYDKSVVDDKFPALVNAFKYGAPPHGGIAPGVDRIVMLLANAQNIREIIAFPMNQRAQDLLMNAPARVSKEQLHDLQIKVVAT